MAILFTASLWADRGLRRGIHALPVSESSAATCLSVSVGADLLTGAADNAQIQVVSREYFRRESHILRCNSLFQANPLAHFVRCSLRTRERNSGFEQQQQQIDKAPRSATAWPYQQLCARYRMRVSVVSWRLRCRQAGFLARLQYATVREALARTRNGSSCCARHLYLIGAAVENKSLAEALARTVTRR